MVNEVPERICPSNNCEMEEHFYCWRNWAIRQVRKAVVKGLLPNIGKYNANPRVILQCVDCGEEATMWGHRDYRKPLDVNPICLRCNYKRGRASY